MHVPALVAAALLGLNVDVGSGLPTDPSRSVSPGSGWPYNSNGGNTNSPTQTPSPSVTPAPSQTPPTGGGGGSPTECGPGSVWIPLGTPALSSWPWYPPNASPTPGVPGVCSALYAPGASPTGGLDPGNSPGNGPEPTPSAYSSGTQTVPISIPSPSGGGDNTPYPSPSGTPSVTPSPGSGDNTPTPSVTPSPSSGSGGDETGTSDPTPSPVPSDTPAPKDKCTISVKQAIPSGDKNGQVYIAGYSAQGRDRVLANLSKGSKFGNILQMKPAGAQDDTYALTIKLKKSGDKADDLLKELKEAKVEDVNEEKEKDPFPIQFSYKNQHWKSAGKACKVGDWKAETFTNFDDKKPLGDDKVAWRNIECSYMC